MVDTQEASAALIPERVGDRLRAARVKAGLDLSDVATRTRVPQRHLIAIEAGDYNLLPGNTYCIGFVKAYARAVGENETELANNLRVELSGLTEQRSEYVQYEAADPAHVPTKLLAWTAAALVALFVIGFWAYRTMLVAPPPTQISSADLASPEPDVAVDTNAAPMVATAPATNGEVVLTATSAVWMRIYDAADKVLFEKEMAAGERYVVPADANNPKIRTGRADLIAVTINGKPVATLGPAQRTVKDVGVSAAALTARPAAIVPIAATPQGQTAFPSATP